MTTSPSGDGGDPTTVIMVIAVWGEWHTEMLLDLCIPSLLSPGNLPAFVAGHKCILHLYTRKKEWAQIRKSSAFKALCQFVDLDLNTSLLDGSDDSSASKHHEAWQTSTEIAISNGCYIWNMLPDVAFADGSIRHLSELLSHGYDSIMWFYPRVVSTTFKAEILKPNYAHGDCIDVSKRDLAGLTFQHLHPVMTAYDLSSEHFPTHPELLLKAVPNQGIAARMLINVHNLYDPSKFMLNEMQLTTGELESKSIKFITDSDDFMGVSLAPLGKDSVWYRNATVQSTIKAALWWLEFDGSANDLVASKKIRIHDKDISQSTWVSAEQAMNLYIRRTAASREAMRIAKYLEDIGADKTSFLIYLSIATGALYNAIGKHDRFLLVISQSRNHLEEFSLMVDFNIRKSLAHFLKSFIFPIPEGITVNEMSDAHAVKLVSRNGNPLEISKRKTGQYVVDGALTDTKICHIFHQRIIFTE